jgi:hypothetical protein
MLLHLIPQKPHTFIQCAQPDCPLYLRSATLTEDQIQAEFYRAFNNTYCLKHHNPRSLIFAVPNGGSRNKAEAMKLKATGTYPGASDLIIEHRGYTLYVELKAQHGSQSPDQREFEMHIRSLNKPNTHYLLFRNLADLYTFFCIVL